LAIKILLKGGRDWGPDSLDRQELEKKALGQVAVLQEDMPLEEKKSEEPVFEGLNEGKKEPEEPVKTYKCDVCGKEFNRAVALTGHKRSHKVEEIPPTV
jgi:hypothetical protein